MQSLILPINCIKNDIISLAKLKRKLPLSKNVVSHYLTRSKYLLNGVVSKKKIKLNNKRGLKLKAELPETSNERSC